MSTAMQLRTFQVQQVRKNKKKTLRQYFPRSQNMF